jgi:hypothetical protein
MGVQLDHGGNDNRKESGIPADFVGLWECNPAGASAGGILLSTLNITGKAFFRGFIGRILVK